MKRTLKTLLAGLCLLIGTHLAQAQAPVQRNNVTTNLLGVAPGDGYVLLSTNGIPVWGIGFNNVTINTISSTTINSTTIKVSGNASVKYLVVTNQLAYIAQPWSGPTNVLDLSLSTGAEEWTYSTVTPVKISGLVFDTGYVERGLLSVTNAATTNITITFVGGFKTPVTDSSSSYTVTNGDYAEILVEYRNGPSNQVTRVWH